ncbi:serine hydrolase domain-containing protein [Cucumibacter marinus]|uniref:serine hydrolase domain-containing protein n=1 Tax=Cucumibacter marinus TaxID=1121252 RepID=UPI0003F8E86A|nr:serine hydrolase domain-containing protein [Cucumibacter marinus]
MKIARTIFIAVSILATVISLWFVPWRTLVLHLSPLPETVQAELDQFTGAGIDGVIVYASLDGKPAQTFVSGWSNRSAKTPVNPQNLFKIASITKLYVAALVAKLADRSELDLDRTLAEYLPGVAVRIENADRITLAMLVQHRSGIPNYSDVEGYPWFDPPTKEEDVLEFVLDQPADFAPGAEYRYSNANYFLIGMILEAALGQDYEQLIRREIIDPLGLKNTYTSMAGFDMDRLMSGYTAGYDDDLKGINYTGPMGSMIATAEDVGLFLLSLHDGTLFSPSAQAIYSSLYEYGHTGLLPGYSSIARYIPELDGVVVQFANKSGERLWWIMEVNYDRVVRILREED